MSKHVVVDASLWVARLIENDGFHELSSQWLDFQRSQGIQFVSPTLLLVEVAAAISRRTGVSALGKQAAEALENIPDLRLVEMDHEVVEAAIQVGADLGVRGADALYVAIANLLTLPLATLDTDQRNRADQLVETLKVVDNN